MVSFEYICCMTDTTTPRRGRGRPPKAAPTDRDIAAEVAVLVDWFNAHKAIKPETISKAAGLHRSRAGVILRGARKAEPAELDAIYKALEPYQFKNKPIEIKNN